MCHCGCDVIAEFRLLRLHPIQFENSDKVHPLWIGWTNGGLMAHRRFQSVDSALCIFVVMF